MRPDIDLFRKTPRSSLGPEALALHDAFSDALWESECLGVDTNHPKHKACWNLVEAQSQYGDQTLAAHFRRLIADTKFEGRFSQKARITIAIACVLEGSGIQFGKSLLQGSEDEKCFSDWFLAGGLHLTITLLDVRREHLKPMIKAGMALVTARKTIVDKVTLGSFDHALNDFRPLNDLTPFFGTLTEGHLSFCAHGYYDFPVSSRDQNLDVLIEALSDRRAFANHPKERRSAALRDLMRVMIFNPGMIMMVKKIPAEQIEKGLLPIYQKIMSPFLLDDCDSAYLWRRALLCLYSPFPDYLETLDPAINEMFSGGQARSSALFRQLGVDIDSLPQGLARDYGLSIIYDPRRLEASCISMPGWAHPLDAFGQCQKNSTYAVEQLLEALAFTSTGPDLETMLSSRVNDIQAACLLKAKGGYSQWLDDEIVNRPEEMPLTLRIENVFPVLDLKQFTTKARFGLIGQYARFLFHSFFREGAQYGDNRLEDLTRTFRKHTDPHRAGIQGFGQEMITAMSSFGVLSDEIIRDLEFTGFDLSRAEVPVDKVDLDTLFARDLGL